MPISAATLPITADDEALHKALAEAHLPSLLPALAQATGDLSLLRADLVPDTAFMATVPFTPEQEGKARALAFDALVAFRDGGCREAPPPSIEALRRMLDHLTGGRLTEDYLPLLVEELALSGTDGREPHWHKDALAPGVPFRVAIVGAGMSGILAAVRLRQAGVPFVILEKNDDLGGTWLENTYPGCRVDVANHLYSYSFAQKDDWPQHFSTQDVLLDYFHECAAELGVSQHIRFRTEVLAATWSEDRGLWTLRLRAPGGEETLEAQALISAVGQLNRPKMPDIPGIERFKGEWFHSAEWHWDIALEGKKVCVIGTGCSAAQFVPVVADQASELSVFQRTAPWFFPTPDYHDDVSAGLRWLFRHVPNCTKWYRFWLFWTTAEGALPAARVDPDWRPAEGPEYSVGAANDELRALLTEYLRTQFGDDPELFAKVVPHYPPASKRAVRDNGIWAKTLKRDHVHLITEPIGEITARGVLTRDGTLHPADVIIYGTGFQAARFLTPMQVTGRGGVDLHEQWNGNARAYVGITIPSFPNFFCLYGPNTNIVVNGSIIYFSECEVQYVLGCLRLLLGQGHRAMECRQDVHDAYNVRIDSGNLQMAWGVSKVSSWYKSPSGRVAQNWPFTLLEYWQQTREPNPADYEFV